MKATISTSIDTSISRVWTELQKTSSLVHVASPILIFSAQEGLELPASWRAGNMYPLSLYGFHVLPLGKRNINIKKMDDVNFSFAVRLVSGKAKAIYF